MPNDFRLKSGPRGGIAKAACTACFSR